MIEHIRMQVGTVRLRVTLTATLVVALALAVGATALIVALNRRLVDDVEEAARSQAVEVAQALEAGQPPVLEVAVSDEQLVQILDPSGDVVGSSPNVADSPAVVWLAPGQIAHVITPLDDDAFAAVAVAAQTPNGPRTVIAARALVEVVEVTKLVRTLLIVGLPALLVIVALTTWLAVGRALAPVELMRREADEISAANLHRRLPESKSNEVSRLAATLNRMLARLENARERQRRFVSDASHELRSPISAIRQHAEVALAHPDQTRIEELAEVVRAENLRLQRLVDDLLVLAGMDEQIQLVTAPVDVDDLVLDEARRLRASDSVSVDTVAVSAARVNGDAVALGRVLRNLGENAARHARGRIALGLTQRDGAAVVTVDDDGPGIPVADRGRVLQRFVRLDSARGRDDGGSGLGLAIVAEVARAHGGSVLVCESPLGGARVEVRLPVAE